jgi:stage IV sporulation protein FB
MRFSFPIGRLFGTQVRVHSTLLLLLAWVFWEEARESAWQDGLRSVLFFVMVFACVVSHEFGHVWAARRCGIWTSDITLLPIGGMARLERIPEKPAEEIGVAVAGPVVSGLLGLLFWTLSGFDRLGQEISLRNWDHLPAILGSVNFGLLFFNLLPAFPMDGGRVLRAFLAIKLPYLRATEWAAWVGKFLSTVLFASGLLIPLPMLSVLAVFIYVSAARETLNVSARVWPRGGPDPTVGEGSGG